MNSGTRGFAPRPIFVLVGLYNMQHLPDGEIPDLEIYLVRLLFCMFAGDTGIFPKGNFYHYTNDSKEDGSDLSHRISDLFEVLNMDAEARAKRKLLSDELKPFP